MAPKTIRSQYHATCRLCEKHIRPGDTIEWQRGSKPAHIECAQPQTAQPAQPQYPTNVQSVIETVGQLTRERDALVVEIARLRAALATSEEVRLAQAAHVMRLVEEAALAGATAMANVTPEPCACVMTVHEHDDADGDDCLL